MCLARGEDFFICQLNQNWQMPHVLHYFHRIAPKLFSFFISLSCSCCSRGWIKGLFFHFGKSFKFNNLFRFDYALSLSYFWLRNYLSTNLILMIFVLGPGPAPQNKQITAQNKFGTNFRLNRVNAKANALVKMQNTKVVELAPKCPTSCRPLKLPLQLQLPFLLLLPAMLVAVAKV